MIIQNWEIQLYFQVCCVQKTHANVKVYEELKGKKCQTRGDIQNALSCVLSLRHFLSQVTPPRPSIFVSEAKNSQPSLTTTF